MITNEELVQAEIIYNYMDIKQEIHKSDCILGCGCANLQIPVTCSKLYQEEMGEYIIFTGGLGKSTRNLFCKSEAQIYEEIAIKQGIPKEKIYVEPLSTNTGDNFRFSLKLIQQERLKCESVILVHNCASKRRTLATANKILTDKKIYITSPECSFNKYIESVQKKEMLFENICVMVGNVQRMVIFPQFGWQEEVMIPKEVLEAYQFLKKKGFTKYIFSSNTIKKMIQEIGLEDGKKQVIY